MKPNPVGWFEIYVQDMPRATAFYEAMLATKLEKLPMSDPEAWPDLEMWAFPMDCNVTRCGRLTGQNGRLPVRRQQHARVFQL